MDPFLRKCYTTSVTINGTTTASGKKILGRLIFIRHGESVWNISGKVRFTGWADIPLSEVGRQQARAAGKFFANANIKWDIVYTSLLQRSLDTYKHAIDEMDRISVQSPRASTPVVNTWRLNERHYGALIGLSKDEALALMGTEKVIGWRRSWHLRPPPMEKHPFYHAFNIGGKPHFDGDSDIWTKAKTIKTDKFGNKRTRVNLNAHIPLSESLEDCANRVLPLWQRDIFPRIMRCETVLVVAHSNTIRSMVKHIDGISETNVRDVVVPSAIPLIYSFGQDTVTKEVRPLGKASALGMRGRFIVNEELLELSLLANQQLELSENLDEGTEFKDAVQYALDRLHEEEQHVGEEGLLASTVMLDPGWMTFPHDDSDTPKTGTASVEPHNYW